MSDQVVPRSKYVEETLVAAQYVREEIAQHVSGFIPVFALTLGSGLSGLAEEIQVVHRIPYADIPHFPILTVPDHKGELVVGHICGVPLIGLSGRKHFYEVARDPNGMDQVVFPVHVMANLGVKVYFATNAVGGLNVRYGVGNLMVIKDHIDLFMPDPLTGAHHDFGNGNLYFQPQNTEYAKWLRSLFHLASSRAGCKQNVHEGVYVARTGRTYETAATSRALRMLGADAVGMSVIPEVVVATNRGMETLGVSMITNLIAADGTNATSHVEVMNILGSKEVKDRVRSLFSEFFAIYRARYMK